MGSLVFGNWIYFDVCIILQYAVIYNIYIKIQHPDVVFTLRKNIIDFIQDSFASLVQFEPPQVFKTRPTCSSGNFFSNFMHRTFFQFLLHAIICLCFENLSACVALLMWNWTGMLLVLAYNCNLRANLVYKPTSAPINSYQVNSTLFFFFKTNTRTSRNIYKIIKLFF